MGNVGTKAAILMKTVASILRHLAQFAAVFLAVALVTVFLSSIIPGDYFSQHLGDPTVQSETIARWREQYGLDRPFYLQYISWLGRAARGDLGVSLLYREPVGTIVADSLLKSLWLGIPALLLGFGAGIALGTCHGMLKPGILKYFMDLMSSLSLSLPSLLLGLAGLLFAAKTGWFPLGSMSSAGMPDAPTGSWFLDRIKHLVLPVACLTVPILAAVERIHSSAVRQSCDSFQLRAAMARGLSRRRIFFGYIIRPALNPVLSTSGPIIAGVLSGSLVLEEIFAWPGIGHLTYVALMNRDIFLILGCITASGALLVAANLGAELSLFAVDPRTRPSAAAVKI